MYNGESKEGVNDVGSGCWHGGRKLYRENPSRPFYGKNNEWGIHLIMVIRAWRPSLVYNPIFHALVQD